jgi:hypothetical protein
MIRKRKSPESKVVVGFQERAIFMVSDYSSGAL